MENEPDSLAQFGLDAIDLRWTLKDIAAQRTWMINKQDVAWQDTTDPTVPSFDTILRIRPCPKILRIVPGNTIEIALSPPHVSKRH